MVVPRDPRVNDVDSSQISADRQTGGVGGWLLLLCLLLLVGPPINLAIGAARALGALPMGLPLALVVLGQSGWPESESAPASPFSAADGARRPSRRAPSSCPPVWISSCTRPRSCRTTGCRGRRRSSLSRRSRTTGSGLPTCLARSEYGIRSAQGSRFWALR